MTMSPFCVRHKTTHGVSFGLNWAVGMEQGDTLPSSARSEVLPPHLTHFRRTIKSQQFLPGGLLGFTLLSFCPVCLRTPAMGPHPRDSPEPIQRNSAFFWVLVAEESLL